MTPQRVVLVLIIFCLGWLYWDDIQNRRNAHECKRDEGALYVGETCYLSNEWGTLFRLYDGKTGELLAERQYLTPEPREPIWEPTHVIYDVGSNDGFVRLPPTWWDRLWAKLP
ncbi:hypothetical protein LMG23992_03147 [Cupriavidus laharis]|uniref:DUF3304 domain-containing protein n=1 Tax=Cupriavidus laharis TaxID=151654 RepID=A0ABM8X875_9BURK|nr:hypothetical protein LMG23992_03147 [Cupriavidus laharis]